MLAGHFFLFLSVIRKHSSKYCIIAVVACGMMGCNDEGQLKAKKFSGIVLSDEGLPVGDASVALKGDLKEYSSSTDQTGKFLFNEVDPGEYLFTVEHKGEDLNFIEFQMNVEITSSTSEQTIQLPEGVILNDASEITGSSVKLSWNKSEVENFLEYKLYRHSTSGLDETTGTLVHVATNVGDTVFTDQGLKSNEKYYYRVFVRNDFGLYGGSNIIELTTAVANIVQNGNLESGMTSWELYTPDPCVTIVEDVTAPSGTSVFKFEIANSTTANISSEIFQTINHTAFVGGAMYRLSLSARVDELAEMSVFYVYLMQIENYHHAVSIKLDNSASRSWTTYTKDFIAPSSSAPLSLFLYLEPKIPYQNELIRVYVDDISITRK